MKFGLKWFHMARYELILKLDGALWLGIILKPLLTPNSAIEFPKIRRKTIKNILGLPKNILSLTSLHRRSLEYLVSLAQGTICPAVIHLQSTHRNCQTAKGLR